MENVNSSPVIGILSIDIAKSIEKNFGEKYKSYISSSYVKFLECSGARVIPIWIGKDENYYRKILSIINGVLMPGGGIWFNDPENGKAAYSAMKIYEIANEMNKNGIYFPIWGTCLGFQLMLHAAANGSNDSRFCNGKMDVSMKLEFESNFRESRLFKDIPDNLVKILNSEPVSYHYHQFCITKKILDDLELSKEWFVTGVNRDDYNSEFVSTIEHRIFPYYGVAFHPEKSQFEFQPNSNISHTQNAIKASQYFSSFFVKECCKNRNLFDENQHGHYLIYNFPITFTGLKLKSWRQCYLFEENIDYPVLSSSDCDHFEINLEFY